MEGLYHNPVKGPLGWMVANRRSGQFGLEEGAGGSDLLSLLGPKAFEFQTRWRKKLWNQAAPQFHGWSYIIAMNMTDIIMVFLMFFAMKMTMNWGLIHPSPPGRCQASMLWPVWLVPPSRRRIYKALRRPGRKNSPESHGVFKGFLCEGKIG